ncbi:MAG: chloride channel protein [Candidatus Dormibacteria bacterium]
MSEPEVRSQQEGVDKAHRQREPPSAFRRRATRLTSASSNWLRSSRLGILVVAVVVGVCGGFGAVGFRWLIFAVTWLVTGHKQFGQQGWIQSAHLPWLGIWFLLLIPAAGGLLYGPLIQRFAREARGHGVPEVMIAVAEDGGRIRPQVTIVKAVASALCIGVGGSVGREGPIVQIGSALASTVGQIIRMSQGRLRILVACGAAAGISATFNAPVTGVFFGFELILREFSIDALLPIIVSSVLADIVGRAFFGSGPLFRLVPHGLLLPNDIDYLLVAVLGLVAALLGVGFKSALYRTEDLCDRVWDGRPQWCRPAVGGIALGALLLALPQLYGIGYPVVDQAVTGQYVLWFLVLLAVGKIAATSLTIGIGGSGGVFGPSLFIGAMGGTAFGVVAEHLFGPAVGSPAIYGLIAMGAVFAAAAQAPLTALASVAEMTGNFSLLLPIMLAVGLATGVSKRLTYGTIYTTKLLRRGTDIDRPRPSSVLQVLTVADVMQQLAALDGSVSLVVDGGSEGEPGGVPTAWTPPGAEITDRQRPQALFANETLEQALRQLVLYGPAGLPVISVDGGSVIGWVTNGDVVRAMADRIGRLKPEVAQASMAAEFAAPDAAERIHAPSLPLDGYELIEVRLTEDGQDGGRILDDVQLPAGSIPAAVTKGRRTYALRSDTALQAGDRLLVLVPMLQVASPAGGVDQPPQLAP